MFAARVQPAHAGGIVCIFRGGRETDPLRPALFVSGIEASQDVDTDLANRVWTGGVTRALEAASRSTCEVLRRAVPTYHQTNRWILEKQEQWQAELTFLLNELAVLGAFPEGTAPGDAENAECDVKKFADTVLEDLVIELATWHLGCDGVRDQPSDPQHPAPTFPTSQFPEKCVYCLEPKLLARTAVPGGQGLEIYALCQGCADEIWPKTGGRGPFELRSAQ